MYAITRSEKCKMSDVGGIEKEVNRSADHKIELIGSNIDWSKTPYNRYLVESSDFKKSIKDILAQHGITKYRKDAVVMIDSFFGFSPEFMEKASPETIEAYFRDCLAFAEKHLGVVFNARTHVDETTFHLHIESVPIVKNEDGSYSLSAKRLMGNKVDYSRRQDLFYTEVGEKYGFDKCVKQEDRVEKKEHLDALDFKTKMRTQELEKLTDEVEIKADQLEMKETEIQVKNDELKSINEELQLKTSVLRTAFDRVERVCATFFGYVEHLYQALADKVGDFLDKISNKEILSSDDFYNARMSTEEVFISDNSGNGLYVPITGDGERLSWADGQSPVYENFEEDSFVPYGSIDKAGRIETENLFDWSERFTADGANDFVDPAEKEIMYALDDLSTVKNEIAVVLGLKTDLEISEEQFRYPDEKSIPEVEKEKANDQKDPPDRVDQPECEDDDDSYDDIGID